MPVSIQQDDPKPSISSQIEKGVLTSRSIDISNIELMPIFNHMDAPRIILSSPRHPLSVSFGSVRAISASGQNRFKKIKMEADSLFSNLDVKNQDGTISNPKLFGGFSFDSTHQESPPWSSFPAALFILPKIQLVKSKSGFKLTVNEYTTDPNPAKLESFLLVIKSKLESGIVISTIPHVKPQLTQLDPSIQYESWISQINEVLKSIESGSIEKVVLAQSIQATLKLPCVPINIFQTLCDQNPGCCNFLFEQLDGTSIFGATPELLVSYNDKSIRTEVLAGSSSRGKTLIDDNVLSQKLMSSSKDQHEHSLVVQTLKSKMESFTKSLNIAPQKIKKLTTVQHLWTEMSAYSDHDEHILSIAESLHPTPAISGIPSTEAQKLIRSTEPFNRGWYGGLIGWFDTKGNGEFSVAIRSAISDKNKVTLYAGAGVVLNSNPQDEWDEIQLKFQSILNSLI